MVAKMGNVFWLLIPAGLPLTSSKVTMRLAALLSLGV